MSKCYFKKTWREKKKLFFFCLFQFIFYVEFTTKAFWSDIYIRKKKKKNETQNKQKKKWCLQTFQLISQVLEGNV